MRLGRRSWVTGGGGVLAASCLIGVLRATLVLAVYALVFVFAVELGFLGYAASSIYRARHTALDRRWQEQAGLLRGSVSAAVAQVAAQSGTKVWGVYVVGDEFHHGVFPRKKAQLMQLYPHLTDEIAQVALFPDATRARRVASQLQSRGFSLAELLMIEQYVANQARRQQQ